MILFERLQSAWAFVTALARKLLTNGVSFEMTLRAP
jgi:hypothetical protein